MGFAPPSASPTQADLQWFAELFAEKAAFVPYGRRVSLRIHSSNAALVLKLLRLFGGLRIPVASSARWVLYGPWLKKLLVELEPLLVEEEQRQRVTLALVALATEGRRMGKAAEADFLTAAGSSEPVGGDSSLTTGFSTSGLSVDAHIPPMPWAEDEPILEMVAAMQRPSIFLAETSGHALAFAKLCQDAGLLAEVSGLFVKAAPKEVSA